MSLTKGNWIPRVVISLAILVSGVALAPYVELPKERLGWQLYAGIYEPLLSVNFPNGRPGSYFTIQGSNFPATSLVRVTLTHPAYGTLVVANILTDNAGSFNLILLTSATSQPGTYSVMAAVNPNASALTTFALDPVAPLRPQVGQGLIVRTPGFLYLPLIFRNTATP